MNLTQPHRNLRKPLPNLLTLRNLAKTLPRTCTEPRGTLHPASSRKQGRKLHQTFLASRVKKLQIYTKYRNIQNAKLIPRFQTSKVPVPFQFLGSTRKRRTNRQRLKPNRPCCWELSQLDWVSECIWICSRDLPYLVVRVDKWSQEGVCKWILFFLLPERSLANAQLKRTW